MYVSSVFSELLINRVWLPILVVVSRTGEMNIFLYPFAPENLVSRDRFGRPVPRQLAHSPHTQAQYGAYSWDSSRFPRRRQFQSRVHIRLLHDCVPMAFGGGGCAARLSLSFSFFPVQQTMSGIGHRVKYFFSGWQPKQ